MRKVILYLAMCALLLLGSNTLAPYIVAQQLGLHLASATCPTGVVVTTTGPTVVASAGGISTQAGQTVRVMGVLNITNGAGTTAMLVKLVRGVSASGTSLNTPTTVSSTAGATASYAIGGEDSPGEVAGQQYSAVISPTGASGAGTVVSCELWVMAY